MANNRRTAYIPRKGLETFLLQNKPHLQNARFSKLDLENLEVIAENLKQAISKTRAKLDAQPSTLTQEQEVGLIMNQTRLQQQLKRTELEIDFIKNSSNQSDTDQTESRNEADGNNTAGKASE